MKSIYLAIALLAPGRLGLAQQDTTAPPKPAEQRSASDDDAARRQVDQANQAVRRAAQMRQQQAAIATDGAQQQPQQQGGYTALAKVQKAAWLGLNASAPPPALRHQLKLPDGTGLVVEFVQPKSPAEQAGIKQYDLLVKLNDQLLINPEQLAVLVRTFKPGEEVKLTFFREGERQSHGVKLVEHDVPPLSDFQMQYFNDAMPNPRAMEPVRENPFGPVNGAGGGERSLTWLDGKKQITVNVAEDQKSITITDTRSGKVLYQGPIDAVDKQKDVPKEAKDAIERLKQFLKNANTDSGSPPKGQQAR